MATIKVLLAGGRAAGRIVEVADDAIETTVDVVPVGTSSPDALATAAPASATQTYAKTERVASGYPVWDLVN